MGLLVACGVDGLTKFYNPSCRACLFPLQISYNFQVGSNWFVCCVATDVFHILRWRHLLLRICQIIVRRFQFADGVTTECLCDQVWYACLDPLILFRFQDALCFCVYGLCCTYSMPTKRLWSSGSLTNSCRWRWGKPAADASRSRQCFAARRYRVIMSVMLWQFVRVRAVGKIFPASTRYIACRTCRLELFSALSLSRHRACARTCWESRVVIL